MTYAPSAGKAPMFHKAMLALIFVLVFLLTPSARAVSGVPLGKTLSEVFAEYPSALPVPGTRNVAMPVSLLVEDQSGVAVMSFKGGRVDKVLLMFGSSESSDSGSWKVDPYPMGLVRVLYQKFSDLWGSGCRRRGEGVFLCADEGDLVLVQVEIVKHAEDSSKGYPVIVFKVVR